MGNISTRAEYKIRQQAMTELESAVASEAKREGTVQGPTSDTTDLAAVQRDGSPPPALGHFVYTSGARPLDGYTIKRAIGQGGFGEIYYATSDAGKEVALKLIRRNLEVELRGIRQCLNLKHPNLLSIYDIRQDGQGDTWVVMEYMSGRSLEEAIVATKVSASNLRRSARAGLLQVHAGGGVLEQIIEPSALAVCEFPGSLRGVG